MCHFSCLRRVIYGRWEATGVFSSIDDRRKGWHNLKAKQKRRKTNFTMHSLLTSHSDAKEPSSVRFNFGMSITSSPFTVWPDPAPVRSLLHANTNSPALAQLVSESPLGHVTLTACMSSANPQRGPKHDSHHKQHMKKHPNNVPPPRQWNRTTLSPSFPCARPV